MTKAFIVVSTSAAKWRKGCVHSRLGTKCLARGQWKARHMDTPRCMRMVRGLVVGWIAGR
jgi:hypothetical protein